MTAPKRLPPWHEHFRLPSGRELLIRPIRPEDAGPIQGAFGLLGPEDSEDALRRDRAADRKLLSQAIGSGTGARDSEAPLADMLRFVSSTPCPLLLVSMEDLTGALDQPNLPGTIDTHPNWRQRLPLDNRACFADPAPRLRLDAARAGRGRP